MSDRVRKSGVDKVLLIKAEEVCRLLGISDRTLARLEQRGLIKSIRIIRHKLYAMADVESLVEQMRSWKP
jgi:DNA-binding transcriptional MerR regulator